MQNIMKLLKLFTIGMLASTVVQAQDSKKVLFIGNSYTGVNNLPQLTENLALSLGDTLVKDSNTPGGTTFNSHTNNSTTLSKIGQGGWDYVILQAQSQEPSFSPGQVAAQTKPYAEILVDSIRSADECAVPLFYMTWGRKNGDASNCAAYPPICTYAGMQERLRASYLEMGDENNAEVSPVGAAWKYIRDNHPTIELYSPDESHPSIYGSYLAACVHYASIFKKSPVGATFISSISAGDAAILQNAAKLVVVDSMDVWNFGVNDVVADFGSTQQGTSLTYDFSNGSLNANSYSWDFGDGNVATSTTPSHTFASQGTYSVTLIAENGCDSDTASMDVTVVSTVGISENNPVISIADHGSVFLISVKNSEVDNYQLIDINGKVITSNTTPNNQIEINKELYSPGIYILNVFQGDKRLGQSKIYMK